MTKYVPAEGFVPPAAGDFELMAAAAEALAKASQERGRKVTWPPRPGVVREASVWRERGAVTAKVEFLEAAW
jgi:hypothetical protein